MQFVFTDALATFYNLMNNIFSEYIDVFVVVYLDDIVVYNDSLESHVSQLRKALLKLQEHKLYLKLEKCAFAQQEIDFLGHILERGEVKMDPKKVAAITDWEALKKVMELHSFLELANYYRKSIKGYSKIVAPLTDLLKKNQPWT